ncbi:SDR family NAD(P)-dependent oxidoreductase [Streptomyces sp. NBRC 109706]|uniref:SDR family NAD(P)-dependent oxidoreductase n=1 Tax=Streptomyces sp. NBRC 109706 TaxID=1550035 RepID=UPI000785B260|nr:SDR family NAD(P)-dependent oxidoreductase [Streptomyces sp. NBRC 109706]
MATNPRADGPSRDDSPALTTPFSAQSTAREVIDGVNLSGRRAVVTGGASGLGAETVRALATAGAQVTIATRRPGSAEPLVEELAAVDGAGPVHAEPLDLSDPTSVDAFVRGWHGRLDILVANAGIMALPTRTLAPNGWEMQLATNYLGHFALASGLHEALREAGSARIVVVSSGAHLGDPFDFVDPHFEDRPYDPWAAYGQSKSADVLLAVGARRWAADGITANALNPGYILTGLQRHVDDDTMRAFGVMDDEGRVRPLSYYKTPEQGAATSVLLAASPLLEGVTGRYFEDNQEAPTVRGDQSETGGVAAHAIDPDSADRLWDYGTAAIRATTT